MAANRVSLWLVINNFKLKDNLMKKNKAFTIVELLTSITIIALLIGILLPSITMVRRMAKETAQKAQFATMDMVIEAFKQDYGEYPESDWMEPAPMSRPYCGAQKLTEALLGWDLQGFHPKTAWRRDGYDNRTDLPVNSWSYDPLRQRVRPDGQYYTLFERKGPYLDVAKTSVFRLGNSAGQNDGLYNLTGNTNFDASLPNYVICDVFGVKKITIVKQPSGETVVTTAGSPILYYRAKTSSKMFTYNANPNVAETMIYNYYDNYALLKLGVLPSGKTHQLMIPPTGTYFFSPGYKIIDEKIYSASGGTQLWPHRPDTYILISAGADHSFGTEDDIFNF
jgi:type II secretory pathway pseudopilin PulG